MDKGLIVHTVIYNTEYKVLVIKRSKVNDVLPEYWDIPGGTLEDGEDPTAGVIREAKEETNLDIKNPALFFQKSNVDTAKNKQFITLVFLAEYPGGEVILKPEEHEDCAWIELKEIETYKTVDYLSECLDLLLVRFLVSSHIKGD